MKIEDIDKAVKLNKRRETILDTIRAIECDPTVEIAIIKPYKHNIGNYTLAYMDDDFKAIVVDYIKKELKEVEEEIHEL